MFDYPNINGIDAKMTMYYETTIYFIILILGTILLRCSVSRGIIIVFHQWEWKYVQVQDRNEEIDKDESDMREDMRFWRRYVNTIIECNRLDDVMKCSRQYIVLLF